MAIGVIGERVDTAHESSRGFGLAPKIARQCCKTIVFQIFIGPTRVKLTHGAQMNTNLKTLALLGQLVHTRQSENWLKNAQKFSKMPPR
jgi:hypothetical protein